MRSQLHVAERGEPGGDDNSQDDQPGLFAEQHPVNGEQQKTESNGEIPPGVETSRDGQSEDSASSISAVPLRSILFIPYL